jgi:hypothetical protein
MSEARELDRRWALVTGGPKGVRRTVNWRGRGRLSSCLVRCGSRVNQTVTTGRDSRASQGITASQRVTGNPSILPTRHHGTARHSQLPKLDVGSSPGCPGAAASRAQRPRLCCS